MDTPFLIVVSTCLNIKTAFLPFLDLISAGLISAGTYDHLTMNPSAHYLHIFREVFTSSYQGSFDHEGGIHPWTRC